MAGGIAAASHWPALAAWVVLALVCMAAMGWFAWGPRRSSRAVICWAWVAFIGLSGVWLVVRDHRVPPGTIERYLALEPSIQRVQGVVEGPVKIATPRRGPFGAFTYEKPDTFFVIKVDRLAVAVEPHADVPNDGLRRGLDWRPASGRLLGKVEEAEPHLRAGQFIEAVGWSARFGGPVNPGEHDFALAMQRRGIAGRITMTNRGNWSLVRGPQPAANRLLAQLDRFRQSLSDAASHALRIGLRDQPEIMGLLDRVVLGRDTQDISDLEGEFRRVGLAHLLAISGAHLGVLLGLTWLGVRFTGLSPPRACLLVLVVLGMYLLAVPVRVPVARASIMAGLLLGGYATGRGRAAEDRLAAAAILVLFWRPGDLFDPGFQLSFITVWALIRYTPAVSRWLLRESPLDDPPTGWKRLGRRVVDALSVSVVAFCAAAPVVAYHFQLISPPAIVLSFVLLPVFVLLLGLGYLKAVVGIALPSVAYLLAAPVGGLGRVLAEIVGRVDRLPLSSIELARPPSAGWVVGVLCFGVALLEGWFARRRLAPVLAAALLVGWIGVEQNPKLIDTVMARPRPPIVVHSFNVGDGSCHVVQVPGHTLMFDCGSRSYPLIGARTVVPGLRAIGVRRIDTLVVSHGDLDHFAGVLDVAESVPIGRILVPPQLLAEARDQPWGATRHLVDELANRGVPVEPVTRGWQSSQGTATIRAMWPESEFTADRDNETSVVLSVVAGHARLLLVGDIEDQAMTALMRSGDDLRAQVLELPHHGSFEPDASPQFLEAVGPELVLQSAGRRWSLRDKWAPVLAEQRVDRLVTAEAGMIRVTIDAEGNVTRSTFLPDRSLR